MEQALLKAQTKQQALAIHWAKPDEITCAWLPCQEIYRRPAFAGGLVPTIDYAIRLPSGWSTARGEFGAVLLCPAHTQELIQMEKEHH